MIKDEDVLSLEEFLNKYGKDLENNITEDVKENMVATVLDIKEMKKTNYCNKINDIYNCILHIKYIKGPKDISLVRNLIHAVIYLSKDPDFKKYNKEELCNTVYNKIYILDRDIFKDGYLNKDMDEEFYPDHLLDLEYYFNMFLKFGKEDSEFIDQITNNLWRYL